MEQSREQKSLQNQGLAYGEFKYDERGKCENVPLVEKSKIILPPIHIKLGLTKNFIKALNKEGQGFMHLREMFPKLSLKKLK